MIYDYLDPWVWIWYTDDYGNKVSRDVPNEIQKVINNKFTLNEIPDYGEKVNFNDLTLYEIDINESITESTQYKVDYSIGMVYVHPDLEGDVVTVRYASRGYWTIPASRVYDRLNSDGSIYSTLEDYINTLKQYVFKGNYDSGTSYEPNNIVYYKGSSYINIILSINIPPTNSTYWRVLAAGMNGTGDFDSGTQYYARDIVYYNYGLYMVKDNIIPPVGTIPTNINYWDILFEIYDIVNNAINATNNANNAADVANNAALIADIATTNANIATNNANNAAIDANTVATYVQTIADEYVNKGLYVASTPYTRGNEVYWHGSSFRAKQLTQENDPPIYPIIENDYWITTALKGADILSKYYTNIGTENIIEIDTENVFQFNNGSWIKFLTTYDNTSSVTINIDNTGAKSLRNSNGELLIAGDLKAGIGYEAYYNQGNDCFILSSNLFYGDMLKQLYDVNNDGIVNAADIATNADNLNNNPSSYYTTANNINLEDVGHYYSATPTVETAFQEIGYDISNIISDISVISGTSGLYEKANKNSFDILNTNFESIEKYITCGGTINALSIARSGFTLVDGNWVKFKPRYDNTSSVTINIDNTGAKSLRNSNGELLIAGDLKADKGYEAYYNLTGDYFILVSNGISTIGNVQATTGNISYYVSTTGNDANTGLSSGQAFKTIQHAIDILPQVINYSVSIFVLSGTYPENINISGFIGGKGGLSSQKGMLRIIGSSNLDSTRSISSIVIRNNTVPIVISGFNITSHTEGVSITVENCSSCDLSRIRMVEVVAVGISSSYSFVTFRESNISNTTIAAIRVLYLGQVFSSTNTGTGNNVVFVANSGGRICKESTQPSGVTTESISGGGEIR